MSEKHPSEGVPGCGFIAYSILLIAFFALGVIGMVTSSMALFQAYSSVAPSPLLPGSQVAVWRLQPFRDVGLLDVTEVPGAWHDETLTGNGATACAMTETAVLRVEEGQGSQMAYTDIGSLAVHTSPRDIAVEITSRANVSLTCHFRPKEGGDRFGRMIAGEAGLEWEEL